MTDTQPTALPMPVVPGMSGLSVMARGGYATVYRATQESVGREVAIKIENRTLDNERDQARFLREARAAGRMSSHPHVVDLFDVGVTADRHPYLIMELCDGSYADRMRVCPLTPAEARDLGVKIADALAHAHASGVLHRDVKPANLLHSHFNPAVLADFGLAVLAEMRDASVTLEVLTPAYAPPEMFRHAAPSPSVDVYALCATLYAVMRGKPPRWQNDRNPSLITLLELFSHPIPDLPGVPAQLTEVLRYGMANEPGARPSAEQLRDLLAAVSIDPALPAPISGAPISGSPAYVSGSYSPVPARLPHLPPSRSTPPPHAAPASAGPASGGSALGGPASGSPAPGGSGPPSTRSAGSPMRSLPDDTPTVRTPASRPARRRWLVGAMAAAVLVPAVVGAAILVDDAPGIRTAATGPTPGASGAGGSLLPGCLDPLPGGGVCPAEDECYDHVPGGTDDASEVPCDTPHSWEVFALGSLPTSLDPTDHDAIIEDRSVRKLCSNTTFKQVTRRADTKGWEVYVLPPRPEAVRNGDRRYRCLAGKGINQLRGPSLTD